MRVVVSVVLAMLRDLADAVSVRPVFSCLYMHSETWLFLNVWFSRGRDDFGCDWRRVRPDGKFLRRAYRH